MTQRIAITVRGAVQGVGFRPFVYRLATEMQVAGWVLNSPSGVFIEVEGDRAVLDALLIRLESEKPPRASIQSLEWSVLEPAAYSGFEIRPSITEGETNALVLPDIAACADCMREVLDPRDRRYHYPFANCTNCGPRYSIIEALPYDRPNTTMRGFTMCADCHREYEDPRDRRFHAQPIACPVCGPRLETPLRDAAQDILGGKIVAVKGVGGFHLMVDARNHAAVDRLRQRKHREEKPFALMYPTLDAIASDCFVSPLEQRALTAAECPIVLLRRREEWSSSVAPGNPYLGVMLPPSPLHHLILAEVGRPVVATSGNLSDEPICTDNADARTRLSGIADAFLMHNRPIARPVDDSIVRIAAGREMVLRRARGYAPLPIIVETSVDGWIAVGAHLKNSVAVGVGRQVFLSQHIGDLENQETLAAFENTIASLTRLYRTTPEHIACDLHPDYLSTRWARAAGPPVTAVQHHVAHVASCMAENRLSGDVLGVSWDGTGYGLDGTVWGGEFLIGTARFAALRTFRLPGGEQAVREPRRAALGVLYEIFGDDAFDYVASFTASEIPALRTMLARGLNSPRTSSAGRLFDAVAALAGLRQVTRYEGQSAMSLEFAANAFPDAPAYPFAFTDWEPAIHAILADLAAGTPAGRIAARFHAGMAAMIVEVARRAALDRVVLTGGCFQNRLLLETTVQLLAAAGFRAFWHQRVPPNDGGIALGQLVAAARGMGETRDT